MRDLTLDDLRMLADMERKMDAGETPYVYVAGCHDRCAMQPEAMEALGLVVGQTISNAIFIRILEINLENCQRQLDYERGSRLIAEELPLEGKG